MRKLIVYFILSIVLINMACSKDDNENSVVEVGELLLATPLNNATCEGKSISSTKCEVVLEWQPIADAGSYTLTVTNLETNKVFLIQNDILKTNYKLTLNKNVPFSWKVSSTDSISRAMNNSSAVWKFYASAAESVANYAPFPADLIAPIQDKMVTAVDGKITLKWAGSDTDSGSLKYTIYLDKIDGKQTPVAELTNLSESQTTVAVEAGVYYWMVKTSDGTSSSFSQIVRFKVN